MGRIRIAFDKIAFDKYGAWILLPEKLAEKYGKIDFKTVKFFTEDGQRFTPEGGGPERYIIITHMHKDRDTFVEVNKEDMFPDAWLLRHRVVFVEFELRT